MNDDFWTTYIATTPEQDHGPPSRPGAGFWVLVLAAITILAGLSQVFQR